LRNERCLPGEVKRLLYAKTGTGSALMVRVPSPATLSSTIGASTPGPCTMRRRS